MAKATDEPKAEGLAKNLLEAAIASREQGRPLPPGVSWSPSRQPQYLSSSEQAELDRTGQMPETARKRAENEFESIPHFNAAGTRLTVDEIREVRDAAVGVAGTVEVTTPV